MEDTDEEVEDVHVQRNTSADVVFWTETVHDHVEVDDEKDAEDTGSENVDDKVDGWGHEEDLEDSSPEKDRKKRSHACVSNRKVPLILESVGEKGSNNEPGDYSRFEDYFSFEESDNTAHSESLDSGESCEKNVVQWDLSSIDVEGDDKSN